MTSREVEERAAWQQLLSDKQLSEYTVRGRIGSGHFSLIFEADHKKGRCAIKFPLPLQDRGEFENEGNLLSRLRGAAGVVGFRETVKTEISMTASGSDVPVPIPITFHVLELASGTLSEFTQDERLRERLAWLERLRLWRGALRGVHQMHAKQVVHRDLKSDNCLLFTRGQATECKVSDFGRSKDVTTPPTHTDYALGLGDLRFAAPEHVWHQGTANPEHHRLADLYGLGSVLFELGMGVGLTQYALGDLGEIHKRSSQDLAAGLTIDLSTLRPMYESAFDDFEESLPNSIRPRLGKILRRLADPDRNRRCAQNPSAPRRLARTNLEPLFPEVDGMIRMLALTEK